MSNKTHNLHGKKILIIGGNIPLINSLQTGLLYNGADVAIATTGEKGVIKARNQRPDTIILESNISDMTIDVLLKTLSNDELIKNVPIMLIAHEIGNYTEDNNKFSSVLDVNKLELTEVIDEVEKSLLLNIDTKKDKILDISESTEIPIANKTSSGVRVIVIEDDPLLRSLLSARLEKSKIAYQFCHNGDDAIDSIEKYKPTIIILDLMLPGKNGLEILAELRKMESLKDIPVIVFSNKDSSKDREQADSLGVNAFLVKAMTDLNDLMSLILKQK